VAAFHWKESLRSWMGSRFRQAAPKQDETGMAPRAVTSEPNVSEAGSRASSRAQRSFREDHDEELFQDTGPATVKRPVLAPDVSGFKPPPQGAAIEIVLISGGVLKGTLQHLDEGAAVVETGSAAVTLRREQIAPFSRARLFAADYAVAAARAQTGDAGQPAPDASLIPSGRQTNVVDVFFKPFDFELPPATHARPRR